MSLQKESEWEKEFEKKFVTKRLQNGYTEIGGLESNVDVVREIKEFISKIISESVNRAIDKNNEENVRYYGLSQAEYEMIQLEAVFEREKEIAEEVEKTYGKDGGPALVIIESHEGGVTQRPALEDVLQIIKH